MGVLVTDLWTHPFDLLPWRMIRCELQARGALPHIPGARWWPVWGWLLFKTGSRWSIPKDFIELNFMKGLFPEGLFPTREGEALRDWKQWAVGREWNGIFRSQWKVKPQKGAHQELLSEEQSHYQNLSQEAARTGINTPASLGLPDKIEDVQSLIWVSDKQQIIL